MIITFTPAEGEQRSYIFDPDTFPQPDSERVEELLPGVTWEEAKTLLVKGGAKARRAVLFCFERRAHPSLSWDAFTDFPASAIRVEFTRSELERMAEAIDSTPGLSDAERATARAQFAALMEDAPETPKAPEPRGVPAT